MTAAGLRILRLYATYLDRLTDIATNAMDRLGRRGWQGHGSRGEACSGRGRVWAGGTGCHRGRRSFALGGRTGDKRGRERECCQGGVATEHGEGERRPNGWRQWRAQRVHCTPGLDGT